MRAWHGINGHDNRQTSLTTALKSPKIIKPKKVTPLIKRAQVINMLRFGYNLLHYTAAFYSSSWFVAKKGVVVVCRANSAVYYPLVQCGL